MKKLYYIQPNTKIVELDGRDAILQSTSDIENINPHGVDNGDDEDQY